DKEQDNDARQSRISPHFHGEEIGCNGLVPISAQKRKGLFSTGIGFRGYCPLSVCFRLSMHRTNLRYGSCGISVLQCKTMPIDLSAFGDKLRRYREQRQLAIEELVPGTGIPIERLRGFETGGVPPTGDEVLIL